ncbi:MAG TPA: Ig-like domain-containing protein [Chryseolinea sp.]
MSKVFLLEIIGLVIAAVAAVYQYQPPQAQITVRVTDESGDSVSDAKVAIAFKKASVSTSDWGKGADDPKYGNTNADGEFSASGSSFNELGGNVKKEGYYAGWWKPVEFSHKEGSRWQPWNPTANVILKRIVDPVPMYARRMEVDIPTLETPLGFDLIEADWVAPHGSGKVGDLVVKLTKRVASFNDFDAELVVGFSNKGDGITVMPADSGSALRSARYAPESGYSALLSLLKGSSKERGEYGMKNDGKDYFFRVRAIEGEGGRVVSALYGKIYGGIEYFPISYATAKLRITYYLNPTPNDRNMEFDPKRNLFTDLKPDEQVTAP